MIDLSYLIGNLNKEHGGAQQLLYDICRHLPQDEFEITVYYMFGEGTFQSAFEDVGANVVPLDAGSNYDLLTFRSFARSLRSNDQDILQTNSAISGVWGRVGGTLARVPNIVSVEHSVHTEYPVSNRVANGVTLPLSDSIVGVSNVVTGSFPMWERAFLSQKTDIRVIHNGVDVNAIEQQFENYEEIRTQLDIDHNDPVIGTVGRFKKAKGYEYLIRSFPAVKRAHEDAQLLLIGGGECEGKLKREARATGFRDDIVFAGQLPNVFPYLPIFDVAVFPSLWESFGLSPVEAMVARRPIVATNIPAFEEVIGEAGHLVEPKNESELATAIATVLDDEKYGNELAERGYRRAVCELSIERTVEEYVDLYRDLVTQQ